MHPLARPIFAIALSGLFAGLAAAQQLPARPGQVIQLGQTPGTAQPSATGRPGPIRLTGQPGFAGPQGVGNPAFSNQFLNVTGQPLRRLNQPFTLPGGRFQNDFNQLNGAIEPGRAARLQEQFRGFGSDFSRSARGVLGDQQMSRMQQLEIQRRGLDAFNDPDIGRRLNLAAGCRT